MLRRRPPPRDALVVFDSVIGMGVGEAGASRRSFDRG